MVARKTSVSSMDQGVEQAVPSGLGGAGYEQPYGNSDRAGVIAPSGTSSAWSDDEVAAWAFGEGDDVTAASPFDAARGALGDQLGSGEGALPALRDRLNFEGPRPSEAVAFVDTVIPPGFGVKLAAEVEISVGLTFGVPPEVCCVNDGGGWFEVEAAMGISGGVKGGAGGKLLGEGADLTGTAELAGKCTRTFRVPWTRLADEQTLAAVLASAAVGWVIGDMVTEVTPSWVIEALVGGKDLTPYLMEEELEWTAGLEGEAAGAVFGEELSGVLRGAAGVTASVSYEDLADAAGRREGEVRLGGKAEVLSRLSVDLSKSLGIDTQLTWPEGTAQVELVIPFEEDYGTKRYTTPYLEAGLEVGAGPAAVGGSVMTGPEKCGVKVSVELDPVSALWQKALDEMAGEALEWATAGMVELETEGSVKLVLEVSLDHPAIVDAAAIAGDVFRWLATGEVSDPLGRVMDVVQELVRSAQAKLEIDLTLLAVHAQGELEASEGITVGGEGEALVGLIYKREHDLITDPESPMNIDELLALVRGAGTPVA